MKKTFKKTLALLISVLMVLSSVSIGGVFTAQAATSTVSVKHYGVIKQNGSNANRISGTTLKVCNDNQDSNFTIGFVNFDISNISTSTLVSNANYSFSAAMDSGCTENMGLNVWYPTTNLDTFNVSDSQLANATLNNNIYKGSSHINNAVSYFGLKQLNNGTTYTIGSGTKTVDISDAIMSAKLAGKSIATVCFMLANAGGTSGGPWTDTAVTVTTSSISVTTSTPSTADEYKNYIKAVINMTAAVPSNATPSIISNYSGFLNGVVATDNTWPDKSTQVQYGSVWQKFKLFGFGKAVAVYNGPNSDIRIPLILQANSGSRSKEIQIQWLSYNDSNFKVSSNDWVRCSSWNSFADASSGESVHNFGSVYNVRKSGNSAYFQTSDDKSFRNYLSYIGSGNTTVYYDKLVNPDFSYCGYVKSNNVETVTTIQQTNCTTYVLNYYAISSLRTGTDFKNKFNTVSANDSIYYDSDLLTYYKAVANVLQFSLGDLTVNNVETKASQIKTCIDEYNSAVSGLRYKYTFVKENGSQSVVPAKTDSEAYASAPENSGKIYINSKDSTHDEVIYTWPTTSTNRVFTEKSSISYSINHSFINQSSSDSNKYTCECGAELDATSYNKAISSSQNIGLHNAEYTTDSYQQFFAVYQECYNKISSVHSQAELDAYTSKLLAAQTYLVKVNVTIKFVKNVGGTETTISEATYSYGTEQTFDSGITDANITKWTVETADGTSSMHTSLSSVKYVPYKDATIIVYADDNSSSTTNTHKVVFRGLNGSVQEVRYVESLENIGDLPAGKNYSFYTFSSWGEPKTVGDTTYYDAVYTFAGQDSDKCGVHFAYKGDEVKQYEYDTYVKLSDTTEGKTYALSTSTSESDIITYINGNALHTPHVENVYVIECDSADAKIGITGSYTTTSEKKNITVNVKYYIPDGAVRVDSGVDVVLVKGSTKSASQRIKCPNVNNFNEFTKTLSTSNTAITAFEITPYVVYTLNGEQIEVKGSTQTYNL